MISFSIGKIKKDYLFENKLKKVVIVRLNIRCYKNK